MKDMDADYILPKLKKLCEYWYHGIPFAYLAPNGKYIFGTKNEDGKIMNRNVVTKHVAIYISIDKIISKKRKRR